MGDDDDDDDDDDDPCPLDVLISFLEVTRGSALNRNDGSQDALLPPSRAAAEHSNNPDRGAVEQTRVCSHSHRAGHHHSGPFKLCLKVEKKH